MLLQSNLPSWKKISEKELNDYQFCQTLQKTFKHPSKDEAGNFVVINCSDSVQMIAETPEGKLILVNQFRFGSEEFSLEFPAGRLEIGESPIEGAMRELREETGYTGENPTLLATLYTNPAFVENKIYVVKIENCQKLYQTNFDKFEDIETKIVDKAQLWELVNEQKITNCITLSGLVFL